MSDVSLNLEDARPLVREVIRSIDKHTEFQLELCETAPAGLLVKFTKHGRSGKVHLAPAMVAAARLGAAQRNAMRTKIKREIDFLGFVETKITSTKMLRGTGSDSGYFRSNSGGGRGRR